nr:uncharacterized protein LOC109157291 [Ipomoea batatas]
MSKISLGGIPVHLSQVCRKEIIYAPSTESLQVASVTSAGVPPLPKWMEELTNYITKEELPPDPAQAAKIKRRAPAYRLEDSSSSAGSALARFRKAPESAKAHGGELAKAGGAEGSSTGFLPLSPGPSVGRGGGAAERGLGPKAKWKESPGRGMQEDEKEIPKDLRTTDEQTPRKRWTIPQQEESKPRSQKTPPSQ